MNISRENLLKYGFHESSRTPRNEPDGNIRFRYFTFVGAGDMFDIVLIFQNSQWAVEEINTTGERSRNLVKMHIPNMSVEEAVEFVRDIKWVPR